MAVKHFLLIVACVCASSVRAWDFDNSGRNYERTALGDAIDKASLLMLKESYIAAEDKNVIASPLGVQILLTLYASGASEATKQELATALGASNYEELFNSYSRLNDGFSRMDASFFTMANKIYVSDKYTLLDEFKDSAVRSFHGGVETISFADPDAATKVINRWAEETTKGHLKDPVDGGMLNSEVVTALFDIIFFQGHWHVPFEASNTKDEDFHVNKSLTLKKPTMHLKSSLYYHENKDLGAKMIELPYKESGFRMIVVLPDEMDGLPQVIEKSAQLGLLNDVFSLSPSGINVDLHLPKFDIKSSLDLNEILHKVGVSRIFSDPAPGIVKDKPVTVSKAFQKAFVKVDEEGATAGAFTGLVGLGASSAWSPPPPIQFRADHPFLFLILHDDKIIFTGTYTH